jgi:hypothetical protein
MRRQLFFLTLVAPMFVSLMLVNASEAQAAKFKVLHAFAGGTDGQYPLTALVLDSAGNLYGATIQGGSGTGCSAGRGLGFCGA